VGGARGSRRFRGERDLKDRALDAAAEGFSIADLGQPGQPLIYVNQGFERLTGILPHATWEESSVTLEPGDRLFVFSDGLVEARNEAEAEFGVESLIGEARATRHLPLDQSLSTIVQAVRAWVGPTGESDDLSVGAMEAD
jgi:hypothetical protein